jgi:hypothetical protein
MLYASEQAKVLKKASGLYPLSHGRSIFAHIEVGSLGGSGGPLNRAKVRSWQKNAAVYLPIVGLTDLLAFFAVIKNVAF